MRIPKTANRLRHLAYPMVDDFFDHNFRESFLREMLEQNLGRMVWVNFGLIFTELCLLALPAYAFDYKPLLRLFLLILLPYSLYLYLVRHKFSVFSDLKLKLLQSINLTLYFYLAMGLSLASMGKIDMLHTFVAGMVFVVASLHIPLFTMSAMILLLSLGYIALLPNYLSDVPMRMAMTTNVMTFSFIAWIIGIMSNRTRIRSYILLKTLERKNLELEDLSHKDTMTHFYNHTSILFGSGFNCAKHKLRVGWFFVRIINPGKAF